MVRLLQRYGISALSAFALMSAAVSMGQSGPASEHQARDPQAMRGEAILEGKGNCLSCHRVSDHGSHLGPDLSSIGLQLSPAEIEKELLSPRLNVPPQYQRYQVTTSDGQTVTGRLMNQDRTSIQLLDSSDRLRSFLKENLRSYDFAPTPPMPSYRDKLTQEQRADLIAYLMSLKGVVRL